MNEAESEKAREEKKERNPVKEGREKETAWQKERRSGPESLPLVGSR